MLVDLNFDIERLNKQFANRGVTFHTRDFKEDGLLCTEFYYVIDNTHDFWVKEKKYIPENTRHTICIRNSTGIYQAWNLSNSIRDYFDDEVSSRQPAFNSFKGTVITDEMIRDSMNSDRDDYEESVWDNYIGSYGVADNIPQIMERYINVIANNKIVISIASIRKDNQPESGGWRWHKWGEYIGVQNPQCEYLYDEPDIDEVLIFQVYVIK